MAKKILSIPLSPDVYGALSANAIEQGQSVKKYAAHLIASNVETDPSFSQKKTVGKNISGKNILNHGNMVFINGVYYNYRMKGQMTHDRKPLIHNNIIYKVVGIDGNVVILKNL